MNKLLVTGANGLIGKEIVNYFSPFFDVYELDINFHDSNKSEKQIICDITNPNSINNSLNNVNFDFVIHCAAIAHFSSINKISREKLYKVNYWGTLNLINYFNNNPIKYFIFLSSIAVYGENNSKNPITEEYECNPSSDYGITKLLAENYLINNAKFKYSIIRLAPVYSSNYFINIEKRLVPVNLFNKKVYFKIGKGKQLNSFVDLRNVIHAIDFLVNKNNCFENSIYNISDNYNYSINDLLNYFKNKRTIIIKIPRILFNAIYYAAIILFFFKKNRIKSAYYKLTKNNIYDISKINNCGIYFINSLIKNNST